VLIVSVEFSDPFPGRVADVGFSEHVGANGGAGSTEHVSATALLNPSLDVSATVDVALFPAGIALGASGEAATAKSGATNVAVTV